VPRPDSRPPQSGQKKSPRLVRAVGEGSAPDYLQKPAAERLAKQVRQRAAEFGHPLDVRVEPLSINADKTIWVIRSTPAPQPLEARKVGVQRPLA
jgi:hypothetical protein